jgi:hypothetical protein
VRCRAAERPAERPWGGAGGDGCGCHWCPLGGFGACGWGSFGAPAVIARWICWRGVELMAGWGDTRRRRVAGRRWWPPPAVAYWRGVETRGARDGLVFFFNIYLFFHNFSKIYSGFKSLQN